MKPTRNIVKPNTGMWTTKGKVWYQKNDDGDIVTDMRTLNSMAHSGNVKLHEQTGELVEWQGRKGKAHYVDEGKSEFEHKGKKYRTKYCSGSFHPYVEEAN